MANARFEWTEAGSRRSYTLPVNFTWDYQEVAQDDTDRERALDGTLRSYARGLKQRWILRLQYISVAQKEALTALKQAQADIDFYRDGGSSKTFTGVWTNDLDFKEVAPGSWSGSLVLEEV
jgi:hypothetical protein